MSNINFAPTKEQAEILMSFAQKISGLGIKAEFDRLESGPIVTAYYFKLGHSVPISKIINRAEDFALASSVESVTIQRIGGDVVIFVPNKERKAIDFKDSLYWLCTDKGARKLQLPISLGVDYVGNHAAIDLQEQPHILMAGETGSGKSVFLANVLASLAVFKDSSELDFILVDTKRLDLTLFDKLPHVRTVCKDIRSVQKEFKHLMQEIRHRNKTLEGASCRNIIDYHALGMPMKFIVVVMDELADLMDLDKAERAMDEDYKEENPSIHDWLKRFAQISRAAGVHFIAGTQRTSVKVISGDIKVNFPCRIALHLPTAFDSRTILGEDGAENLLGKGDMLVQFPSSSQLKRFHGPFVKLEDIAAVIDNHNSIREQMQKLVGV